MRRSGSPTGSHRWRDSAEVDSPAAPGPAGDQKHPVRDQRPEHDGPVPEYDGFNKQLIYLHMYIYVCVCVCIYTHTHTVYVYIHIKQY